jgi:hypothetical protein
VADLLAELRVASPEPDLLAGHDPDGRAMFNINTREDLALARRLIAESGAHPLPAPLPICKSDPKDARGRRQ